jgi:hypothetical protein
MTVRPSEPSPRRRFFMRRWLTNRTVISPQRSLIPMNLIGLGSSLPGNGQVIDPATRHTSRSSRHEQVERQVGYLELGTKGR